MSNPNPAPTRTTSSVLERVARALEGLRYGTLELVVHDFKIVRITRSEKIRVDEREEPSR